MDSARWNQMSISEQLLNVGGEIQRAVDRKNRDEKDLAEKYLSKALEWLELSKTDPKNIGRVSELETVEEELKDYFCDNKYHNNKESLMSYWNSFYSAIY